MSTSRQWQFANGSELKASSADIGRYSLLLSVMSQGATVLYFVTIRFVFCILSCHLAGVQILHLCFGLYIITNFVF